MTTDVVSRTFHQLRRHPLVVAVAVIAAVAVCIGLVVGLRSSDDTQLDANGEPIPQDPAELVEHYLQSLRHGDAVNALSFLNASHWSGEDAAAKPSLSRRVLTQSEDIAPLNDVHVGSPTQTSRDTYKVPATFRIGDTPVERTFQVRTQDQAVIYDGLITLSPDQFAGSGLRVNGVTTPTTSFSLFPGAYVFDADYRPFHLVGGAQPIIIAQRDDSARLDGLHPELTDDAVATFRRLVTSSLDACLASTGVTTECGLTAEFSGTRGTEVVATRSPTPEQVAALHARVDEPPLSQDISGNPSVYEVSFAADAVAGIPAEVQSTVGGEVTRREASLGRLKTATVDFSDVLPRVVWE